MNPLAVCYIIAINILTFIIFGIDKMYARKKAWRIPEATLFLLVIMGGSIGGWVGMNAWRHKTKHAKFKYGIPLIFALQIAILLYIM